MANDVALAPSRLPIAPALAREYDLTPGSWRVLVESIFPAAKSIEAVMMALAYCKARDLDVFKRPVHIVPIWDTKKRAWVETVWEGIASIRTTASRTKQYAGIDAVEYGPPTKRLFKGQKDVWQQGQRTGSEEVEKEVTYPEWASVVVYRMIDGQRCAYHAKVYWLEAYGSTGKTGVPNDMWGKRPYGQIDKCVEAAALRKAFPEELGSTYTSDEMEGHTIEGAVIDQPPAPPAPPVKGPKAPPVVPKLNGPPAPPARQNRTEVAKPTMKPVQEEAFDPDTGEVLDAVEEGEEIAPADFLKELEEAMATAKTKEEVETIFDDYEVEDRLAESFIGVALKIRRDALKKVQA